MDRREFMKLGLGAAISPGLIGCKGFNFGFKHHLDNTDWGNGYSVASLDKLLDNHEEFMDIGVKIVIKPGDKASINSRFKKDWVMEYAGFNKKLEIVVYELNPKFRIPNAVSFELNFGMVRSFEDEVRDLRDELNNYKKNRDFVNLYGKLEKDKEDWLFMKPDAIEVGDYRFLLLGKEENVEIKKSYFNK